jgi:uncharacterized Zn finger protein (UPF0148 family)
MREGHWRFQCPECGMGDFELGHLVADGEFACEVCREEGRGEVRLERWVAADGAAEPYARLRPDLAA